MDIFDYYFKQIVTQGQLDWAFDRVQDAMYGISVDNDLFGIVDGLGISEHAPTPDKTIDLAGPGTAYDKSGQRCNIPDALTVVDCSQDEFGTDSNPPTATYQRYISVFIRFDRNLTDPALDGNNITVWTKQLESFEVFVRLGAEAPVGTAVPAPLMADAILLGDILVTNGFTAIVNGDIDRTRREDWVRFTGSVLGDRVYGTPKDAVEDILALIESWGGALPFSFGQNWYNSVVVKGPSPPPATMQQALDAIIFDLTQIQTFSEATLKAGAELIGMKGSPPWAYTTTWTNINVHDAVVSVGQDLNQHIGGSAPQHPASAITFAPYGFIAATDVQTAMQEILDDLAATSPQAGASYIGSKALSSTPDSLVAQPVEDAIGDLLTYVNARARKGSAETITASWLFEQLIRLNDENAYIRGEETTSGDYFPIFQHSSLRGRILYSGSSGAIVLTYNCSFDNSTNLWHYDLNTEHSFKLTLSSTGLFLSKMDKDDPNHDASGWSETEWTGEIQWGDDEAISMHVFATASATSGYAYYDRVQYALQVFNAGSDSENMPNSNAVTWHAKLPSALVSGDITVTADTAVNWSSTPTVSDVNQFGCIVGGTSDSIAADTAAYSFGKIEVDMTV